jgi:hypothetical protein
MTDDQHDDRTMERRTDSHDGQSGWSRERTRRSVLLLLAGAIWSALLVAFDRVFDFGYGNGGYGEEGFGE